VEEQSELKKYNKDLAKYNECLAKLVSEYEGIGYEWDFNSTLNINLLRIWSQMYKKGEMSKVSFKFCLENIFGIEDPEEIIKAIDDGKLNI